jgi:hypothetical protein
MPKRVLVLASFLLFVASIVAVKSGGAASKNLTSAPLVPRVVAQVSLTGQTNPISPTTVFTPSRSGLFRISPYFLATNYTANGETWTLTYWFTDDLGSEHVVLLCLNSQQAGSDSYASVCPGGPPFSFRAVAGSPIVFDVEGTPAAPFSYNLFFTVEQLM